MHGDPKPAELPPGPLEPVDAVLGQLEEVLEHLRALEWLQRRELEYGAQPIWAEWLAGESFEYDFDFIFNGIAVFNENATVITFGFSFRVARAAAGNDQPRFTLAAKSFLALPVRDQHISVGGVGAGNAILLPLVVAPDFAGGPY